MLQQHGLGARPYDCSLCSLKFFFRAELDHHVITSHRGRESASPGEQQLPTTAVAIKNLEEDSKECEELRTAQEVRVKDELMPGEEEDVNVDEPEDDAQDRGRIEDQDREIREGEEELTEAKVETLELEVDEPMEKEES